MNTLFRFTCIMTMSACTTQSFSQVTIGSSERPSKAALLQLKSQENSTDNVTSTKGGLLLPRVKLINLNTLEPFLSPTDTDYLQEKSLNVGLVVYNVNNSSGDNLRKGIYSWNGETWEAETNQENPDNSSGSPDKNGAIKANLNQSKFINLSGTQSYGLLLQNQNATLNVQPVNDTPADKTTPSVITGMEGNNGDNKAVLINAPQTSSANMYKINMAYEMGNNPPKATTFFNIKIVDCVSGEVVYESPIVIPGGMNTGHVTNFQLFFPTIPTTSSRQGGYRILFCTDTGASQGLSNNVRVKIFDITRIAAA